ncbi:MAG: hypothetical protein ACD_10C00202G0001 [uncultured bacterium]|nr:MAG: hypothetical protein ACD_10C00202G0001 [uncultured bacterium]
MLHLADNAAKGGKISAQNIELVHAPEFVHDAGRALK